MKKTLSVLAVLAAGVASAQVTKTSASVTVPMCGSAPASSDVDVYRPAGAGPFPLVAIGHGFQNSKDNAAGLAQALGAQGIVVVVPQFPGFFSACGSDHARNARVLLAAVDQQIAGGGIDTARVGFAGHSAGGLSAFLAAAQRPAAAVVLLDPVDSNGLGAAAAASVMAPTLFLFGEPSSCNSQGNGTGWFANVTGPRARLKVVNANHCDPQEPISPVCSLGCGGAAATSTARSAVFKRYAVGFFARYLRGQLQPCLDDTAQTDATAGTVTSVDFQLGGCGAAPDAGALDAGSPDAGGAVDAGRPDAGGAPDGGGAPDAGGSADAGGPADAGSAPDGGDVDGGAPTDAGSQPDAGPQPTDAGTAVDGGVDPGMPPTGCGCTSGPGVLAVLGGLLMRRRRQNRGA